MPKSLKRNRYFKWPSYSSEQQEDSMSAKRRRRMVELETELAALKAAETSSFVDKSPTTSPTPCSTPPPPRTPQEDLFARLPQSRAKTILGMALKLPKEKSHSAT